MLSTLLRDRATRDRRAVPRFLLDHSGELGKRGRLRHDRSTHETTLISGHDDGLYATAALLVHQACASMPVDPTYFIYDVDSQRLDMRDCDCPAI